MNTVDDCTPLAVGRRVWVIAQREMLRAFAGNKETLMTPVSVRVVSVGDETAVVHDDKSRDLIFADKVFADIGPAIKECDKLNPKGGQNGH